MRPDNNFLDRSRIDDSGALSLGREIIQNMLDPNELFLDVGFAQNDFGSGRKQQDRKTLSHGAVKASIRFTGTPKDFRDVRVIKNAIGR